MLVWVNWLVLIRVFIYCVLSNGFNGFIVMVLVNIVLVCLMCCNFYNSKLLYFDKVVILFGIILSVWVNVVCVLLKCCLKMCNIFSVIKVFFNVGCSVSVFLIRGLVICICCLIGLFV